MVQALDVVKMGSMSINQAAIHYHLPYSSLYGRIKRLEVIKKADIHYQLPYSSLYGRINRLDGHQED